jgi:plasmid stability protein
MPVGRDGRLKMSSVQDQDKFVLRFPDGMRESIRLSAKANNRSMNAEIISRLSQSLDGGTGVAGLLRLALSQLESSAATS